MDTLQITKTIIGTAAAFGTSIIVDNIIKTTSPVNAKLPTRVLVSIGAFFIGAACSAKIGQYARAYIDEAVEDYTPLCNSIKNAKN